ncbi:hypothetical protein BKA62DRAFT_260301 [Auriculariales sp. MPI-PUGE-AT-0066]|nr:hypothetical protein BKA62DRAFT_260301 [Auriculariales sp. MPI-PUGE-AT-0066]
MLRRSLTRCCSCHPTSLSQLLLHFTGAVVFTREIVRLEWVLMYSPSLTLLTFPAHTRLVLTGPQAQARGQNDSNQRKGSLSSQLAKAPTSSSVRDQNAKLPERIVIFISFTFVLHISFLRIASLAAFINFDHARNRFVSVECLITRRLSPSKFCLASRQHHYARLADV